MAQPRLARGDMPESRLIGLLASREFVTIPFREDIPAGKRAAASESDRA